MEQPWVGCELGLRAAMPLCAAWALPAENSVEFWEFCGGRIPSVCQCHRKGLSQITAVSLTPPSLAGWGMSLGWPSQPSQQ